jgi:hypothetical protein
MANRKWTAIASGVARGSVALAAAAILAVVSPGLAADRYMNASVDQGGALRIVTGDGRVIVLPKEPEQVDCDLVAISSDGRSVGWLARYPNGSTSYPIPLKLVVYSGSKLRTYAGNELPVWRWHFTAGGKQIAFEQETVHGGRGVHYELREVASGRLLAEYSPIAGPDDQPDPNQRTPKWVSELDAKR